MGWFYQLFGLLIINFAPILLSTVKTNMDQGLQSVNLGYSTKNIPIPSEKEYIKCFISKVEKFMRNIRWRTFFYLNPNTKSEEKETYGFNSTKSPPQICELKEFEEGMLDIVQNIKFMNNTTPFQKQMQKDMKSIRSSEHLLVAADKTTNFYKVKPDQYKTLVKTNITKDYKKAPRTEENQKTK